METILGYRTAVSFLAFNLFLAFLGFVIQPETAEAVLGEPVHLWSGSLGNLVVAGLMVYMLSKAFESRIWAIFMFALGLRMLYYSVIDANFILQHFNSFDMLFGNINVLLTSTWLLVKIPCTIALLTYTAICFQVRNK